MTTTNNKVLFYELPYAVALHMDYLDQLCSHCFKKAKLKCGLCHVTTYCNRDCQSADWTYHKVECKGLLNGAHKSPMTSAVIDVAVRLLCRVLIRYESDDGTIDLTEGSFPSSTVKLRQLSDLMSHSEQFNEQRKSEYFEQVRFVFVQLYGLQELWHRHSVQVMKELLGKCQTNVFDVREDRLQGGPLWLGSGLYLNASVFDHSCDPDVHWWSEGVRIRVSLLKPDSSSNKPINLLTVSYGFGTAEPYEVGGLYLTSERRRHLSDLYRFICQCSLCTDKKTDLRKNGTLKWNCDKCKTPYVLITKPKKNIVCFQCNGELKSQSATELSEQLETAKSLLREAHSAEQSQRKSRALSDAIRILQQFAHPLQNIWFCRANLETFLSASDRVSTMPDSLLGETIIAGEKALRTHELYAPIHDVTLADLAFRLSNLYRRMNNLPRAKEMMEKVRRSWEAKCGPDHPCVQIAEELLIN